MNATTYRRAAEAEVAGIIAERREAPIDFLCGDGLTEFDPNEREALSVALGASKPLPASNAEECRELLEVERLAPNAARRITVADHQRWQQTGRPPHLDDADINEPLTEKSL